MAGGEMKRRFERAREEAVHLRAGGRSRINAYKTEVMQEDMVVNDLVCPKKQFWELSEYRA
eukprot:9973656-Lingulodinium_polyedra.AAC.1